MNTANNTLIFYTIFLNKSAIKRLSTHFNAFYAINRFLNLGKSISTTTETSEHRTNALTAPSVLDDWRLSSALLTFRLLKVVSFLFTVISFSISLNAAFSKTSLCKSSCVYIRRLQTLNCLLSQLVVDMVLSLLSNVRHPEVVLMLVSGTEK